MRFSSSKYTKMRFRAGASPRTPLGELSLQRSLRLSRSWWGAHSKNPIPAVGPIWASRFWPLASKKLCNPVRL